MSLLKIWKNRKNILGINERNLSYIRPYNKAKAKNIADNKLLTKKVLSKNGIPTPKLIKSIKNYKELRLLDFNKLPNSFVIKPAAGLEGDGIQIYYNRDKDGRWIKSNNDRVSVEELRAHILDIIDGKYSLHNLPDKVLIEERVKLYKDFKYYSYRGAPDVRIVIFNNIPIMSYIRFPTKESEGKANLQKGAIGAAIDIAKGVTTYAIIGKKNNIEFAPNSKLRLSGLKIPYWDKILHYAVDAQKATGLGFGAIDFLIDRELGPMVVEINARPGLSIQLANHDGLSWRLRKAKDLKVKSTEKGVRLGKDLFGGEIEENVENITGKHVIGFIEWVTIFNKQNKGERVKSKIDTGAKYTSADIGLLRNLGYSEAIDYFESLNPPDNINSKEAWTWIEENRKEVYKHPDISDMHIVHSSHGDTIRPVFEIPISIADYKFTALINAVDRSKLIYRMIVGRNDLDKFLIDPTKKFQDRN